VYSLASGHLKSIIACMLLCPNSSILSVSAKAAKNAVAVLP